MLQVVERRGGNWTDPKPVRFDRNELVQYLAPPPKPASPSKGWIRPCVKVLANFQSSLLETSSIEVTRLRILGEILADLAKILEIRISQPPQKSSDSLPMGPKNYDRSSGVC